MKSDLEQIALGVGGEVRFVRALRALLCELLLAETDRVMLTNSRQPGNPCCALACVFARAACVFGSSRLPAFSPFLRSVLLFFAN